MDLLVTLGLIGGLVAVTAVIGLFWRRRQGRVETPRSAHLVPQRYLSAGTALTLLQVSAPLCSSCQAMRHILATVATDNPRVGVIDYDVSDIPDIIERFVIRQTPTVLLATSDGDVLTTLHGATAQNVVEQQVRDALIEIDRRADEYRI